MTDVKNQDLWKLLLREIRRLHGKGVNISLWRIPRQYNERADRYAKEAAQKEARLDFQVLERNGPANFTLRQYLVEALDDRYDRW